MTNVFNDILLSLVYGPCKEFNGRPLNTVIQISVKQSANFEHKLNKSWIFLQEYAFDINKKDLRLIGVKRALKYLYFNFLLSNKLLLIVEIKLLIEELFLHIDQKNYTLHEQQNMFISTGPFL